MSTIEIMFLLNSTLWFVGFGIWSARGVQVLYKFIFLVFAIINLLFGIGKLS